MTKSSNTEGFDATRIENVMVSSSNGDGLSERMDRGVKREVGNVVAVFMERNWSCSRGKETVYA